MSETSPPDALLCITGHCPHCPSMLQILADLLKQGRLGRLELINLEVRPEAGRELGVRSVPWVRIGSFDLAGLRGREEMENWIDRAARPDGMTDYFHSLLRDGDMPTVLDTVRHRPETLAALLPIVGNPEASINVRIGAGVVFEEFAGQQPMRDIVPHLGRLTMDDDPRVRADACHYLGLTHAEEARGYLEARLQDDDGVVREIAWESLELLGKA